MKLDQYTKYINRRSAKSTALARMMPFAFGKTVLGTAGLSASIIEYIYAKEAMMRLLRDEQGRLTEGNHVMATITALVFVIVSIGWFHVGLKRTVGKGTPLRLVPWIFGAITVVTFAQAVLVALMDMPRGGTGPQGPDADYIAWLLNGSALVRCTFIVMAGLTAAYGFNMVLKAAPEIWHARKRGQDGQVLAQNSNDLLQLVDEERPDEAALMEQNIENYVEAFRIEATGHAREIDLLLMGGERLDKKSIIEGEIARSAPFEPELPIEIELLAKRIFEPHKIDLSLLPKTVAEMTPRMRAALAEHANWLRAQAQPYVIKAAL